MRQVLKKLQSRKFTQIAMLVCLFFTIAGILISLNRFWQYEAFYYDFGIFDTAIWSVSRFQPPIIDHIAVGERWIFADHFNPSLFLLSPLFWITNRSEILLIIQATAVGVSGFILFLIGKHVLKNEFLALSILICYFLFIGLQNAVITDFHEVTVSLLFFMFLYFFGLKKKSFQYVICLFIFLGFKESNFLVGVGVGLSLFFIQKEWKKMALKTIAISLIWGFLAIRFFIPFFSEGRYVYQESLPFNPFSIFQSFVDHPIKLRTLFFSFLSFGFLPLLSPVFWFLLFQDFLVRFFSMNYFLRWDLGLHYSALLSGIMGVSSIYSWKFLMSKITKKFVINGLACLLMLNAIIIYRFILHGPFGLAYNPVFYKHTKDFQFLNESIKQIPTNSTVMAQNNLATRFSHQKVWLLQSDERRFSKEYYTFKKPTYIIFDNRPGQNPNNYFGVSDMNAFIRNLKQDASYKLFYKNGDVNIYKRI